MGDVDDAVIVFGLIVIEIEGLKGVAIDDAIGKCPVGCVRVPALPKGGAWIG